MNTEKQQPPKYLPEDEQRQDNVREEAVAYANPEFLFAHRSSYLLNMRKKLRLVNTL